MLRGDVDETLFRGIALLPINSVAGRVSVAFQFADGFGEHVGVEFLVDDQIAPLVFLEERRREFEITKAATAFPILRFGDTTGINTINNFPHTWNDMRLAMLAQFNHYPTASHFVCNCSGSARATKRIENPIARI